MHAFCLHSQCTNFSPCHLLDHAGVGTAMHSEHCCLPAHATGHCVLFSVPCRQPHPTTPKNNVFELLLKPSMALCDKALDNFSDAIVCVLLCLQGWEWEGPWEVEHGPFVDAEGWAYAFDHGQFKYPPPPGSGTAKPHDFIRRRRWVRRRRRVALPSSVLDMTPSTSAASSAAVSPTPGEGGGKAAVGRGLGRSPSGTLLVEVGDQWTRRVLGVVEPGGRLPLPLNWQKDSSMRSKQLQVRPVLAARAGEVGASEVAVVAAVGGPSHSWSYGGSAGHHSVMLSGMEDGGTRLLCCKSLGGADAEAAEEGERWD